MPEVKTRFSKRSESKTPPRTAAASGLKPLVLVDRLVKAQEPEPAPKKKRANPGTRLLRLLGLKKKKKSDVPTDYVLITKVAPNPEPVVQKPPFVVSRPSNVSHRKPILQPLASLVRVLPVHRDTKIPRRVPSAVPALVPKISVSVPLPSSSTSIPISRTRVPIGPKLNAGALRASSTSLARRGVEDPPFRIGMERVPGSGLKPLRLSPTPSLGPSPPQSSKRPVARRSLIPRYVRRRESTLSGSFCALCRSPRPTTTGPVSDASTQAASSLKSPAFDIAQDEISTKVTVEFAVQTDLGCVAEERVVAQEVPPKKGTREMVVQAEFEEKVTLPAHKEGAVLQELSYQRQTSEMEVQTEEQPTHNAVDVVQEPRIQEPMKVTVEMASQTEEQPALNVVEEQIVKEVMSTGKVTLETGIPAEEQPALKVVEEQIVKETMSTRKVTVEMGIQAEERPALKVVEDPIAQGATSSTKATVDTASQTEESTPVTERQADAFPVALPKNDAKSIRNNLLAALKTKPKTSGSDVLSFEAPKHLAPPPTSSWGRMKRDSTGLLDELRDRLSRRNTPSATPLPSTSQSHSSTPPKFAALRSHLPAKKENAEPEEGELQQVFRSRKTNNPARIPLGAVDRNVSATDLAPAFGPRKLRRIFVPPVIEGSVPSRNPQIQSELNRLRAQGKVGGGGGAGVGSVGVGSNPRNNIENPDRKDRKLLQKIP
ncbi:hypothetical protein B0H19DRAFT_98883 [Mycena capillaripes]|nr:hypothetical protein B0H19DRAFT_98883 [Mycena capillaripes]